MRPVRLSTAKIVAAASAVLASTALGGPALASSATGLAGRTGTHLATPAFHVTQILTGKSLRHRYVPSGSSTRRSEPLTGPDDITILGHHLFTAFQNGVGPQGEPSSDGNADSTVVEFTASGHVIRQWDIHGKCDGITADRGRGIVIATVNEDANSSLYTIRPGARPGGGVRHYQYNKALPHFGGTDAISIYHGSVLISASAPGTTGAAAPQASYPAVYLVVLDPVTRIATVRPVFYDETLARVANVGASASKVVRLALTDPDSNEIVPASGPRFAGDFMLTSQGDKEQIFLHARGRPGRQAGDRLEVLRLSQSVDDTAWARTRSGRIFGSDSNADTIDMVTGPFRPGSVFVAVTPCDAGDAPATCPGPGFPPNYLGLLNPWTGHITPVSLTGPNYQPKGLLFDRRGA
jgi:hypothetical protein